jgi:predicted transcriptional regulator
MQKDLFSEKGKVEIFTSKTGHQKTDVQAASLAAAKSSGLLKRQADKVVLCLSDGIQRTNREISKAVGIEISNATQAVNKFKSKGIIPTATKTKCKTSKRTVANYTLTAELLNIKKVSVMRFVNEVERLMSQPDYDLQKMILEELRKQGIVCRKTTDKTVLALFEGKTIEYLTKELPAQKVAEIEADKVEVIEVMDIDDFMAQFTEKL